MSEFQIKILESGVDSNCGCLEEHVIFLGEFDAHIHLNSQLNEGDAYIDLGDFDEIYFNFCNVKNKQELLERIWQKYQKITDQETTLTLYR